MTTITVRNVNNGYAIIISGHAGYNPGNDIVCSAVSILTNTLLNSLGQEENSKNIHRFLHNVEFGNVAIWVEAKPKAYQRLKTITDTIFLGYELLADKYPENVLLKYF